MNRLPSRSPRLLWRPLLRRLAGRPARRCRGLRAAWAAAGAAVMLAGCAAPPTRWLALPTLPPAPVASPAAAQTPTPARMAADAPTLSVRRVVLPEYLQATGVRFRTGVATLDEWPDTLWAERLEVAASRRLSDALRRELPDWTICEGVCPGAALGPAVLVEFSSLDYLRPQGRVEAEVRWRAVAAGPESGLIPALLRATRRPGSSGPSVFAAPSPGPGANVPLAAGESRPPQGPASSTSATASASSAAAADAAALAILSAQPLPAPRRYSVPVAADTAAAQAEAIAEVLDRVAHDTAAALKSR